MSGDLRELFSMWKKAKSQARRFKSMGGEAEETASSIQRMRKIQRAMKTIAPEWYTAQIAKGKSARARG